MGTIIQKFGKKYISMCVCALYTRVYIDYMFFSVENILCMCMYLYGETECYNRAMISESRARE